MKHKEALSELVERVVSADETHGEIKSLHESYGLLAEELDELLDSLRDDDPENAVSELLDIATVALRAYQAFS